MNYFNYIRIGRIRAIQVSDSPGFYEISMADVGIGHYGHSLNFLTIFWAEGVIANPS